MDRIKSDNRFSHVLKDPRFRHIPKHERKVKIDKRFEGMFKDKRFKLKSSVDKRGRPVNYSTTEDLKKYYELPSSDGDSSESEGEESESSTRDLKLKDESHNDDDSVNKTKSKKKKTKKLENKEILTAKVKKPSQKAIKSSDNMEGVRPSTDSSDEQENDSQDSDEENSIDLARGEGNAESSDTDAESTSDSEDEGVSHPWGELIQDAPEIKEITHRLAICNMDWDRIKVQDLFTLLHSFKSPEGIIKHVKIYLSDFGKQRLQEEEMKGPAELIDEAASDGEQDDAEGSKFHMEKLRKYQLNRLRYYYAVVECDSPETANKIYEECDGVEYESSATRLDLRFIPDDVVFDEEPVSTSDSLPDPSVYRPNLFVTAALQQAKVNLTWDETDPDRIKATQRAFDKNELAKMDLSAYLASSNSDDDDEFEERNRIQAHNVPDSDEDNETDRISKYRALLQSIESVEAKKKEDDVELEITWEPGLRDATEKLVKQKQKEEETLGPWDLYLQKRKEKKQKKREEKKKNQELTSDEQLPENPYSDDELPSDVDLQDPYFQEELGKEFKVKKKRKKLDKLKPTEEDEQERANLELLLMDDDDHSKHHFNMKSILEDNTETGKKKKKKKKGKPDPSSVKNEDNFEVNVEDNRFSALYTSHLYNVDPSDPQFQKTKGMQKIVEEKLRRRAAGVAEAPLNLAKKARLDDQNTPKVTTDSDRIELSLLVKSIKNKTQNFKRRKEK